MRFQSVAFLTDEEGRSVDLKNDKINNLMNTNAEIGSSWNGRILLKINHNITDTPITSVIDLKDNNELQIINSLSRKTLWTLYIKLYCAYYLPKEYQKYSIKITLQDCFVLFDQKRTFYSPWQVEWVLTPIPCSFWEAILS